MENQGSSLPANLSTTRQRPMDTKYFADLSVACATGTHSPNGRAKLPLSQAMAAAIGSPAKCFPLPLCNSSVI